MVEKKSPTLIKSQTTYLSPLSEDWQEALKKGNLFIKHHKYTSAKLRHIWLSDDLFTLFWRDPNQTSQKPKGSIKIIDISNIKLGLVKAKKINKNSEQQRMPYIFSIITPKRTLELEASSIEVKDEWINLFKKLQLYHKKNFQILSGL